jgi:hypothetical protein
MQFVPGGTLKDVIDGMNRVPIRERDGSIVLKAVDEQLSRVGLPVSAEEGARRRMERASWPEVVCRIGIQLAAALDYAHSRQVLHRDIKPANVLLTAEGNPKLVDFNISFASQLDGVSARTYFGGSLAYMSPEQIEAFDPESELPPEALDHRADLFSLAATLWELLFGQRPFPEEDLPSQRTKLFQQLIVRIRQGPVTPRPAIDRLEKDLTGTLAKALNPDRDARQPNGETLGRELWLCLEPKSRALVELPSLGWRAMVRRWPLAAAVLVALLPNAVVGFGNFIYNQSQLAKNGDEALAAFQNVSMALNLNYFSIGAILAKFLVGPVVALAKPGTRLPKDADIVAARCRSLSLGHTAAIIGVIMWISSGMVFPITLYWLVPTIRGETYRHFMASMTICGLIAAAYPFFGLTFLAIRVYFPAMLKHVPGTETDAESLRSLDGALSIYLFVAAIVPLASMLMVVLLKIEDRFVSLALILSGLMGLACLYFAQMKIREDIAALLKVVDPARYAGSDSDLARSRSRR